MTISSIQRSNHPKIAAALVKELQDFAKRHGVTITVGQGGRLNGSGVTGSFMIDMAVNTAAGAKSAGQVAFENHCRWYGLSETDFGKTFWSRGTQYRITGISPSRPKYPIDVERVHDHVGMKFTRKAVEEALRVSGVGTRVAA